MHLSFSLYYELCVCVCETAVSMVGLKPSDVPPPPAVKVLSAGMAGCIADLVTFPLDTAKVRLQVQAGRPRTASGLTLCLHQ